MESLIQKHSYARSPIRTYGEEDVLGDEVQTAPSRGEVAAGQLAKPLLAARGQAGDEALTSGYTGPPAKYLKSPFRMGQP